MHDVSPNLLCPEDLCHWVTPESRSPYGSALGGHQDTIKSQFQSPSVLSYTSTVITLKSLAHRAPIFRPKYHKQTLQTRGTVRSD